MGKNFLSLSELQHLSKLLPYHDIPDDTIRVPLIPKKSCKCLVDSSIENSTFETFDFRKNYIVDEKGVKSFGWTPVVPVVVFYGDKNVS